jgi:hypothetical protein
MLVWKRSAKILLFVIVLAIGGLMLAIVIPNLPRYNFASVSEARAFGHIDGAEIVDELGDTNGPYRLKGGVGGGSREAFFDFNLTFNGHTTNWSRPISNHMGFAVTIFENRRGNQFAVVRKSTK